MTLDGLAKGIVGKVTVVGGTGSFRRRLMELGLLPGTQVARTGSAPLGDPLSFLVRGAVVCLRRDDARLVEVVVAG